MALTCGISTSTPIYTAGATPPPGLTLTVFNPNAVSVAVTSVAFTYADATGAPLNAAIEVPTPLLSPGQVVVVPALGTLTFGPFPFVTGSPANGSIFLTAPNVIPPSLPFPRQLAMPTSFTVQVGALVYGSDGSANVATPAIMIVSYTAPPPVGTQGGVAQFNQQGGATMANAQFNSALIAAVA